MSVLRSLLIECELTMILIYQQLFLARELAENLDPRDDRTSATRSQLLHILWDRMRGSPEHSQSPPGSTSPGGGPPVLPPLGEGLQNGQQSSNSLMGSSQALQLPPLSFQSSHLEHDLPAVPPPARVLTPITERSDASNSRYFSGDVMNGGSSGTSPVPPEQSPNAHETESRRTDASSVLGMGLSSSPTEATSPTYAKSASPGVLQPNPASEAEFRSRRSEDSTGFAPTSRPDSKLSHFGVRQPNSSSSQIHPFDSASVSQPPEPGRQSPGTFTHQRPPSLSHPSITSGQRNSSRPASPRPSSVQSTGDQGPSSPRFSVLTSPHSILDSPNPRRPGSRLSVMQDGISSPPLPAQAGGPSVPSSPSGPPPSYPLPALPMQSPRPTAFEFQGTGGSTSPNIQSAPSSSTLADSSPTPVQSPPGPAVNVHRPSPSMFNSRSPPPPPKDEPPSDLLQEAGALYFMRQMGHAGQTLAPRRQLPSPGEYEPESESSSAYSPSPAATTQGVTSPALSVNSPHTTSSSPAASTSYFSPRASVSMPHNAQLQNILTGPAGGHSSQTSPSGYSPRMASIPPARKPSGARAAPVSKTVSAHREQQQPPLAPSDVEEDDEDDMSEELYSEELGPRQLPPRMAQAAAEAMHHDDGTDAADALAALSFLEREDYSQLQPQYSQQKAFSPPPQSPPIPQVVEPRSTSPPASKDGSLRSSFAPSKQANQRKAQSEAHKAAQHAAAHKPGRANGKGRARTRDPGAWGESSDEEEEEDEEEDEDEDADSDGEPTRRGMGRPDLGNPALAGQGYPQRTVSPAGPPSSSDHNGYSQPPRRPRDLPQIPQAQSQGQLGMCLPSS